MADSPLPRAAAVGAAAGAAVGTAAVEAAVGVVVEAAVGTDPALLLVPREEAGMFEEKKLQRSSACGEVTTECCYLLGEDPFTLNLHTYDLRT